LSLRVRPPARRKAPPSTAALAWPGRKFVAGEVLSDAPPACRQVEISPGDSADRPPVRLIQGDALDVATALAAEGLAGQADLVYLDPPFASEADYTHEARLDGPADGRVVRTRAYGDRWGAAGIGDYLEFLAPRLDAMTRLLAPGGSIWVHLDWRAAYLVRVLLDEILGRDAFVNEIVWRRAPNLGRQAASHQFGRTLDTIVVYGKGDVTLRPPTRLEPIDEGAIRWDDEKRPFTSAPRGDYTDASIAKLEKEGRVLRTASGKVYIKYFLVKNSDGVWCRERRVDALWTDVPPLRHVAVAERTGFPTQKPRALLERIIACATQPGGTVVDLFSGSGTTGDAAHALGRRALLGDAGAMSIATTRARLLRANVPLSLEVCGSPVSSVGLAPLVDVDRTGGRELVVTLREPREPLAWAIDPAPRQGAPFECVWHSERALGVRPTPAANEARVVDHGGPIAVRVYGDDGSVSTATAHVLLASEAASP
jgi:16S rRNA G966 N2-methylase RsmD